MFRYESSFSLSVQFLRIPQHTAISSSICLPALRVPLGRTSSTGTYVDPLVAWSHVHGLDLAAAMSTATLQTVSDTFAMTCNQNRAHCQRLMKTLHARSFLASIEGESRTAKIPLPWDGKDHHLFDSICSHKGHVASTEPKIF